MIRPVNSEQAAYAKWITSAAVHAGQVLVLGTDNVAPAAEGVSTAIIVGVAVEDTASGGIVSVYDAKQEFEFDIYQGDTVDEGTEAMYGLDYDLFVDGAVDDNSGEGEMYIDLNDTGMIRLTSYDNNRRVATGKFVDALIYI
jgi:hypothetical protein